MRHRWTRLAIVALLATVPSTAGLWSQAGGDAGKTGLVDLAPGPWDVVASYDALDDSDWMIRINGPGFVDTPYGIVGVSRDRTTEECSFTRIVDVRNGTLETVSLPGVQGCWLAGYSSKLDGLIVCRGDDLRRSGVTAHDGKTLAQLWEVTAAQVFGVAGTDLYGQDPTPAHDLDAQAGCLMGAIDDVRGEFVAPWPSTRVSVDFPTHRVASIDLATGEIRWSVVVPTFALLRARAPTAIPWPEASGPNWVPLSVALTSSGVLVAGIAVCPDAPSCDDPLAGGEFLPIRQVNAWLDRAGNPVGAIWSEGDPVQATEGDGLGAFDDYGGGSVWAAAVGPVAHFLIGDDLMQVDPSDSNPRLRVALSGTEGLPFGYSGPMGPVIYRDSLLVFLDHTVSRINPDTGVAAARWPGFGADWLGDWNGFATSGGEVFWEVVDRASCDGGLPSDPQPFAMFACPHRIVVLDASSLELRQSLPHAGTIMPVYLEPALEAPRAGFLASLRVPAWVVPTADAVLFGDVTGHVTVLQRAHADRSPPLAVTSLYPEPGVPVALELARDGLPNATRVLVNWGETRPDGQTFLQEAAWPKGEATLRLGHTFMQPGTRTVLVTVLDEAGTTRTRSLGLDVGGIPPVGPPDALAPPTADLEYPAVNATLTVRLEPPAAAVVEVFVAWGDGPSERHPWGSGEAITLSHAYREPGVKDATFTAAFLDGSTATRILRIDVGGTPPRELSTIQAWFSPENQEVTFFIIGLIVTAIASAFGLLSRRRSRGQTGLQMKELADIRRGAWDDPPGSLARLVALRRGLDVSLAKGRLTENQYHVIYDQAGTLIARLLPHVAPATAGLTAPFRARLEAAFLDGRLDGAELGALRRLLDRETSLSGGERDLLKGLLGAVSSG